MARRTADLMTMYVWRDGTVAASDTPPGTSDRAWVDVPALDAATLHQALVSLSWDAALVGAVTSHGTHTRLARQGEAWICWLYLPRSADPAEGTAMDAMLVVLAPHVLVTAHEGPHPLLDELAHDLADDPALLAAASRLLAEICLRAADGFLGWVDATDDLFDQLEDSVLSGHDRARDVFRVRRQVHAFRLNMAEMRRTTSQLARRRKPDAGDDPGDGGFADVYDGLYHIIDTVDTLRDNLTGLVDLQLNQRSTRLNEIMKFLTIFSTVFLPITFITGFFGMNLRSMPELTVSFGQEWALGLMASIVVVMLLVFRRRGWL